MALHQDEEPVLLKAIAHRQEISVQYLEHLITPLIAEVVIREDYGLIGDAHADCCTHRQVSLLTTDSINKMRSLGFDVAPGDFAEKLTIEGIDLTSLPVGTYLSIGKEVILEVTQIGKECHAGCAIFRQVGKCIMPKEGVFAKVIQGGSVKEGDTIKVLVKEW